MAGIFDILLNAMVNKALQVDPLLTKTAPLAKEEAFQVISKVCAESGLLPLHAGLIFSQGILESTHFTSKVFLADNNAFGMKWSGSAFVKGKGLPAPGREAKTAAQQAINYYAHYATFADSVRDLIRRHISFGINWQAIKTPSDYINFLWSTKSFQGSKSLYQSIVSSTFKKFNIPATA